MRYLAKPRVVFVHDKFRFVMYPTPRTGTLISVPNKPIQLEIVNYDYDHDRGGPYFRTIFQFVRNTPPEILATNKKGYWHKVEGESVYEDDHEVWPFIDVMLEAYVEASVLLGEDPMP
jgi:hypothetical protein